MSAMVRPWEGHVDEREEVAQRSEVDVWVGGRVRLRRTELRLTRIRVAEVVGVNKNMIERWEMGAVKISPGRLWALSRVLDCTPAFFFEGYGDLNSLGRMSEVSRLTTAVTFPAIVAFAGLSPDNQKVAGIMMQALLAMQGGPLLPEPKAPPA